jgi:hypothetical protein
MTRTYPATLSAGLTLCLSALLLVLSPAASAYARGATPTSLYLPALIANPGIVILGYSGDYFEGSYDVLVQMRNESGGEACAVQALATVTQISGVYAGDATVPAIHAGQTFPILIEIPAAPSGVEVLDLATSWEPCSGA